MDLVDCPKTTESLSLITVLSTSNIAQKQAFQNIYSDFLKQFVLAYKHALGSERAQLVVNIVLWPCPSRGSGQILRIPKFNLF